MSTFTIGENTTDHHPGTPPLVVAEIGNAHQGQLAIALKLIDAAKAAGCAGVKFQVKTIDKLYTPEMLARPYGGPHSFGSTYGEHKRALELSINDLCVAFEHARNVGIEPFATCFDEDAVDRLEDACEPTLYKVHSGGMMDKSLLYRLLHTGKPLIISTGGRPTNHIYQVMEYVNGVRYLRNGSEPVYPPVAFLHCTAEYPVEDYSLLQLRAMCRLKSLASLSGCDDLIIGWSGHVSDISTAVMAYALGARIIEQHFTLNRAWKGTDHGFSLEPQGMAKLVRNLNRAAEAMRYYGDKQISGAELDALSKMERKWVDGELRITGERGGNTGWEVE